MVENLVWASGYNLIAIPVAAGVLVPWGIDLPMAIGAIVMSVSTIIVAANAQLLRRLRPSGRPGHTLECSASAGLTQHLEYSMQTEVTRLVDPVCGMSVRLDAAEQDGLVLEHHGTLYAFCRRSCRDAFVADPHRYAEHAPMAAAVSTGALPVIDEGMRKWYESCSCCLSDAYPDVKAALDAERAAAAQAVAGPGICEIAEGAGS